MLDAFVTGGLILSGLILWVVAVVLISGVSLWRDSRAVRRMGQNTTRSRKK